jgi:60 kDa SS-A/Ro ribonucleoprotein
MSILNTDATQTQIYDNRQIRNSAGGYSFAVENMDYVRRFLILGSEGAQYSLQNRPTLSLENCPHILFMLDADGQKVVEELVKVSLQGRAPKQEPTLFVLALAARHKDLAVRKAAFDAVQKVCRTATMLFTFLDFYKKSGVTSGWGRLMRDAISSWYNNKDLQSLIYQVTKYGSRNGWSHQDVLRLAHTRPVDQDHSLLYKKITSKNKFNIDINIASDKNAFNKLLAIEAVKLATEAKSIIPLITEFNLVHEQVPSSLKLCPDVWDALLDNMPLTALIRNLGAMTSSGLLVNGNSASRRVREKLSNLDTIKSARIHPFNVLTAYNTYAKGVGQLGHKKWNPSEDIIEALDSLFYTSFTFIDPSHKRTHLAIDVSRSMDMGTILGSPGMSPRFGAAAMSMATLRSEDNVSMSAFSHTLVPLQFSPKDDLQTVIKKMRSIKMGATDCALPITTAMQSKTPIDTFVIYTDNETWFGNVHPMAALRQYRDRMGIPARLIVVAMKETNFTIADPEDAGALDVVGFDSATPAVIAEFSRGEL